MWLISSCFTFLLALVLGATTSSYGSDGSQPFTFEKNDLVAIYGSGLADRMQHDPWVEAVLQSHLQGQNVRFRTMSFSGDTVAGRPRDEGYTNEEEYLQHVAPSVVFAMFGYNESFAGAEGVDAYQAELVAMVNRYRAKRKEAGVDARFVLFSPIAYESTGDVNLPEGTQLNANLAAYTEATRRAAEISGATFVDLYSPTFQLFASSPERFTVNGIHLNPAGYRQLANIISQALLGKAATDDARLNGIYQAVRDKNWHWHNRFNATDGNDVWGSRSTLTFVDGQSNAEVLKHELTMLDVTTANRDLVIWAAAEGRKVEADDSNVPPPIKVISNVGGDQGGPVEYLSPEESISKIKVPKGYELNVFASEQMFPDMANPVQMQVDSKGRLWAACWNTYPKWEPLKAMNDTLMIFEDTNGDGVADERKIFAHVHNPLGFEFWGGGVIVTCGPDLLFLKDTDGDDVADQRTILLQGLGTSDTHHAANNLIYGPDGGIYWQSGIFLVHNHESPWKQNLTTGESGMYRFDPRTFAISPIAANTPNPHGTSFDYWGYLYANDGTGGRSYQVRTEGNGFKMHELLKMEFRPVAANEILSSEHFPEDMQQDFLICNTIGFLGVKQYNLDRDGGKDRKLGEVWGTPGLELLNSQDRNFRPTDAIVGTDGALYVSDWCNVIIGHMQHNIRDPNRDHHHGRIVRLTIKDRPLQKPVAIADQPIEALLENLKHPTNGVRHRTRVELSARDSKAVIAATQKWITGFDPNNELEAHHLLEALWLHQQHNVKNEALLNQLLNSSVPHAVEAAKTVRHFWFNFDAAGASGFAAPAEIEIVKYEVPKRLSAVEQEQFERGSLIYQREAHCATCHLADGKGNGVIYPSLVGSAWVNGSEDRLVKLTLHGLWGPLTVHGKTFDPARGVPPMTAFKNLLSDQEAADVLTFVRNNWGNSGSSISAETVARVRAATTDRSVFWKPEELLAQHPLEAELALAELGLSEEGFSNKALEDELLGLSATELAKMVRETGNVERGKELFYKSAAACASCHDPTGGAPRIGPDLASLNSKISPEELIDSMLRPSDRIDKDFAQVTVLTVDGTIHTGLRISEDDDQLVLRNLAEPKPIVILRDDIEEVGESRTSLMPANLTQTLKTKEEFMDLMRYVLEIRKH